MLTLVVTMTLFVAEPDIAYAQTPSADTTLENLVITGSPDGEVGADMTPTFAPATTTYEARIPFTTTGVVVTATVATVNEDQEAATIKVNGRDADATPQDPYILPGLNAGRVNTVNIEVTAESGDKQTYTVKVYRERQSLSDNANLRSLSISPGRLSSGFSASETSYNARVTGEEVTVSYRLSDTAGGVSAAITAFNVNTDGTVNNITDSNVDEMDVRLGIEASTTRIMVTVTPESGSGDEEIYMIDVYHVRANPETNANLRTLDLTAIAADDATADNMISTDITLDTNSEGGIDTEYKARVETNVEMLTVVAAAADAGAIVTLPRDQNANVDGNQVFLRKGALTTFTVRVVAEDPASTMTYTVEVYRNSAANADLSDDADLTRLSLSAGALSPSFTRDEQGYEATVGPDVDKITVSYSLSDTSGGADAVVDATDIDGNEVTLAAHGSDTTITVTVTPESTTPTKIYTITVYRTRIAPSADASLSALTVTGITADGLSPAFAAGPTGPRMYNATAENSTGSVTVDATATAEANGATFAIDPESPVDLTAGMTTTITITVTAEDGATTSEYMVDVYRQRVELSEDATLSALSLSDGDPSPAFMSDRMEYDARVGSDVDKVTVSYTPTDNMGGVSVEVSATERNGMTECNGDNTCAVAGMEITLDGSGSETIISVEVTPESGDDDIETYMVTVYRERRNLETEARLSAFTITDDNPATDAPTQPLDLLDDPNRDRDVGYRVRSVLVTVTPMDSAGGAVATITAPPDNDPTTALYEINLTAGAETIINR